MKISPVSPTTTADEFLALFNDGGVDVIELAAGEYRPGRINISGIDRTSRPLIIRPTLGAKVLWNGDNQQDTPAFVFGYPVIAPAIGFTFDGRNGFGSSWLFTNYNVGYIDSTGPHGTGIIWMGGSHHLKFLGLNFAGNTGTSAGQNAHTFYISNNSASEAGRSHDIEIAYCKIDGGNRQLTGSQTYHDPGPYNVDFHDNEVANCDSGCVWYAKPSTNMTIRNNWFTDCDRAIDIRGPQGIASGNVVHNATPYIETPFVDNGTNVWEVGSTMEVDTKLQRIWTRADGCIVRATSTGDQFLIKITHPNYLSLYSLAMEALKQGWELHINLGDVQTPSGVPEILWMYYQM